MKRGVQILLLVTCMLPVLAGAREETMEERKRRITRKYLRERVDITYSDRAVPEAQLEDETVLDSEKFKEAQVELQRQEPGAAMPPPMRRPTPQPMENSNWLLTEESEQDDPYADPFADPFALKDSKDDSRSPDLWSNWNAKSDTSPYSGTQRESRFNWRGDGNPSSSQPSGGYGATRQGIFGSRDTFSGSTRPGYPQQNDQSSGSIDALDLSREKSFNPALDQTRLQSPFPIRTDSSRNGSFETEVQPRQGTYTPHKSPYEQQREQRKKQWGNYTEPQQEYRRPDRYQQWKKKSQPTFDPMSDDAYIEEMMPRSRR